MLTHVEWWWKCGTKKTSWKNVDEFENGEKTLNVCETIHKKILRFKNMILRSIFFPFFPKNKLTQNDIKRFDPKIKDRCFPNKSKIKSMFSRVM